MIPVVPINIIQGQEVWARMPQRPQDPLGAESNVELMGFVLAEGWLNNQKVWHCRAFESYGVWSSHPEEEEVRNIRSIRTPLSEGALFRYGERVQVRGNVDHDEGPARKAGVIVAGWCEKTATASGTRLQYSYWVLCQQPGLPEIRKWYQQEDLEHGLATPQGIPRR